MCVCVWGGGGQGVQEHWLICGHQQLAKKIVFRFKQWGGARCSSVVRAFIRGAMGRRIDPSW